MLRVLYVCADRGIPLLGGKGASVHVRAITSAIQALGHEVTVAVREFDSGERRPANRPPAVRRIEQLSRDEDPAARQLSELIEALRIDLVIERYSLQSGAARTATRRHGLPLTLEINAPLVAEATQHRGLSDPGAQAWEHETFRSADRLQVVSSALLDYVRSVAPEVPSACVPNGTDIDAFRAARPARMPELDGRLVIGFAGSMKPWHGVADLLDAFAAARMPQGAPPPVLLLVGDGPEKEQSRHRAAALGLADRIVFTGARPHAEIPELVRRFDIGVAPYRPLPGFYFHPLKIVEYLAAGIPVIYPRQGDLPELVGSAGVGYEPGSVSELAYLLGRLAADDRARSTMAARAVRRSAEFAWSSVAERVLALAGGTIPEQPA